MHKERHERGWIKEITVWEEEVQQVQAVAQNKAPGGLHKKPRGTKESFR